MAVLVIGAILAKEKFLLELGALMSGKIETVDPSVYGSAAAPDFEMEEFTTEIARTIRSQIGADAAPEITERIEQSLTDVEFERIREKVIQ